MASLIRNTKIAADSWQRLERGADGSLPAIPATGDIIVPLALWQAASGALPARSAGRLGVWLDSDEDPVQIADSLAAFGLIAVNFSQFTDGRGYSTARLLRERYGWKGPLRAVGDVQRDQLFYLARCGFDEFLLADGQDAPQEDLLRGAPQGDLLRGAPQGDLLRGAREALSAFGDFTDAYQTSVERPLPLFRRRHLESPQGAVVTP
jgi:uncharacterized protein (DUF934 family)